MSVNARRVGCKEPTKFVAGFYDGPRGEHGCFYDCENEACAVNQILRCAESKEAQKMMQIQEDNGRLGMYAGEIAAERCRAHDNADVANGRMQPGGVQCI